MNSKVTVITVCYNAENEIEKTINSVLAQTYKNLEYIIVDGDSKDRTKDIVKKYTSKISFFLSEPDKGIYDAMNKGISLAKGEWVCFMNAGDTFIDNDTISNVFSYPLSNRSSVLYGDVVLDYSPYGYVWKRMNKLKGINVVLDLCHQATFTKLSCYKEEPFDLSYKIFGDIHTFYSLWKKGGEFVYIPVTIALFEAFDGVSSNNPINMFLESNRMLNRKFYNSAIWWKELIRACLKISFLKILPDEAYKKWKYNHILAKNEAYYSK